MTRLGEMTLEDAAREAAGNWQQFSCFAWHRKYDLGRPEDWAIIYTHNRDSGLLDQSNASAIAEALDPFTEGDDPDVVFESHDHWAVGHVDGFSLRVYRDGQVTDAFRAYHDIAESLADYPVLNDEDHSRREHDATIENIEQEGGYVARHHDIDLPDDWSGTVFSWFWKHNQSAVENRDGQGGYPSEAELLEAFTALGWLPADADADSYSTEDDPDAD